jgi:hypothetical protein
MWGYDQRNVDQFDFTRGVEMSKTGTQEAFDKELEKNIIDNLRIYADVCEAGGKIHWAKAMREAAKQLRDGITQEREECAKLLELSNAELLLITGEMSRQELRTVKAVKNHLAKAIRSRI